MKKINFSFLVIVISVISIYLSSCQKNKNETWEYKVYKIDAVVDSSYYNLERAPKQILIDDKDIYELNALGAQGWELVSVHDEIETALPCVAKDNLAMFVRSNVRSSAIVLIFKRRHKYG